MLHCRDVLKDKTVKGFQMKQPELSSLLSILILCSDASIHKSNAYSKLDGQRGELSRSGAERTMFRAQKPVLFFPQFPPTWNFIRWIHPVPGSRGSSGTDTTSGSLDAEVLWEQTVVREVARPRRAQTISQVNVR